MRRRTFIIAAIVGGAYLFGTPAPTRAAIWDTFVFNALLWVFFEGGRGTVGRMVNAVWCALQQLVCWGVYFIADQVLDIVESTEDVWPDLSEHETEWNAALDWMQMVNAWVPLTWGIECMGLFFAFYLFVIGAKWTLKLIPTMG